MWTIEKVRLVLGATLLAGVLYALVGAPGFMSDLASTVAIPPMREAVPVTVIDKQVGDELDLIPEQALFWVACYLTSQSYGGSAEGGWWYDEGELVTDPDIYRTLGGTPRSFLTKPEADVYAAELALLNQDRPPKHASTSQGIYEVQVLQAASLPTGFPAARSHYE